MRIALAVPHTPWIPERVESLSRLLRSLDISIRENADGLRSAYFPQCAAFRLLTERAPNWKWSLDMWRWFADQDVDWCLQLQDDVIVAPNFWPALQAMLSACPGDVVGLEAAHPAGPALAKQGHRWYTTRAWVVGVAWAMRKSAMVDLLFERERGADEAKTWNEDDYISEWSRLSGRDVWHPIPAIHDHDTDVESTYNNDNHQLRHPTVLWKDYDRGALEREEFWRPKENIAHPHLISPYADVCWFCGSSLVGRRFVMSKDTAARMCTRCVTQTVGVALGVTL